MNSDLFQFRICVRTCKGEGNEATRSYPSSPVFDTLCHSQSLVGRLDW